MFWTYLLFKKQDEEDKERKETKRKEGNSRRVRSMMSTIYGRPFYRVS